MKSKKLILILSALLSVAFTAILHAQTSAFTYQGRLLDGTSPANGSFDLTFTLYDSTNEPGAVIAGPVTNAAVTVSNGLFTTMLDFGAGVFDGSDRWLEIGVATNGSGVFTNLSPRQLITSAPYAIRAATATDLLDGSVSNPSFIGTTSATPLTLFANNQTALRLESPSGNTPNLIAGGAGNSIDPLAVGSTIAGGGIPGFQNSITANDSFIGAGNSNSITGPLADSENDFIGAGYGNAIDGEACFIGSGNYNAIQSNAWFSVIGGGAVNTIQATAGYGTIGGGTRNTNAGFASVISGGRGHVIGTNAPDSTISGGFYNTIEANSYDGVIGGGALNTIQVTGKYGIIGGGTQNTNAGTTAVIGGGRQNLIQATAFASAIAGGRSNTVANALSFIGAGQNNTIAVGLSFVGGGENNVIQAGADHSFIGGGQSNTIVGSVSLPVRGVIVGGTGNLIQTNTPYGFIGGGAHNTNAGYAAVISGGAGNTIGSNASYATIPGGADNVAGGQYSLAVGWNAHASHNSCFVWSDGSTNTFSTTSNQFVARASGGFVLYSDSAGTGVSLAPGSGSWSTMSDRNAKDDFGPVTPETVLARVASLPMTTWSYKTEQGVRHIGPMAQDFYTAFKVGEDDRHIADVDEGGVALAAIQGLNEKVESGKRKAETQETQIEKLKAVNTKLRQQLHQLTRTVNQLKQKINGGAR